MRWPRATVAVVVVLALAGTAGALSLKTDAGTDTLVDEDSAEFKATEDFRQAFGDEAAVVLVREDLRQLTLTSDLSSLFELETCLAGGTDLAKTLPRRKGQPLPEVCDKIAELAPSRVVYGPATFLYQSVAQIQQVLAGQIGATQQAAQRASRQAEQAALDQGASEEEAKAAGERASQAVSSDFQQNLVKLALRFRITRPPRLDDPEFINRVVFDPNAPEVGTPKERFAYLFPSRESALISVRLRPDLTDDERSEAIDLFRQAVKDPRFALGGGGDYTVTGVPAVVDGLSDALRSELLVLLAAAIVVMAIVLGLVFSPPLRLLPLGIALVASALTFGLLSLLGGSLTMASVAVLPVLIGLAVDYAIQFQARFGEAQQEGMAPARAAVAAAARGGPVIGAACLATAAGLAALVFSPIPMVRSFGLLLVAGIGLAFLVALTGGFAALALAAWRGAPARAADWGPKTARFAVRRRRWGAQMRERGKSALAVPIARPGRVLGAALVLAVCGWAASTQTEVVSDIRDLAPASLPALQDVNQLQDETGVSGEINVVVRSDNLADPRVINWISGFQNRVLDDAGYSGDNPSCAQARLCPAISLTDLFSRGGGVQSEEQAKALIASIPPYFSQAVVTRNQDGTIGDTANVAFGIRVQPLDDQQRLIDDIRGQIGAFGGPPDGTEVQLAGLPVIAAQANEDLSQSRYWLPLISLAIVALVLAALFRSLRRALVPLIPIVLATGWSALVVAAMGVPLNPMSATLGVLVIAVATEFSVILAARYEEERAQGLSVGEALRNTYERTGTAVLASGITSIAGFGVLIVSGISMLRDFGLVTIVDLTVALAGGSTGAAGSRPRPRRASPAAPASRRPAPPSGRRS